MVIIDCTYFEYFNTTKLLNWRQVCWAGIFSQFNFKIVYHPHETNGKADALSHHVDPKLEAEVEKQDLTIPIINPGQFQFGENKEALL